MDNKWKKIIAIGLCGVLFAGGAKVTAYATSDGKKKEAQNVETENPEEETSTQKESVKISSGDKTTTTDREETLYVFAGADGEVRKIVVSDELRELMGSAVSPDDENLLGMKDELPVRMHVDYTLDGKKVKAEDMKGRSGHVKINFQFENTCTKKEDVNGRKKEVYVPYIMITGMILDNDVFSHIEVTNGKTMDDGDRTMVAGIALPGLQENLELDKKDIEFPDHFQVEADVKDFHMMETMTVATNELIGDLDTDKFDSVDGLKETAEELTKAMDLLLDGSSQLKDGLSTLDSKTGELSGGIATLQSGANDLNDGAGKLDAGALQIQDGAQQLSTGLSTLTANNETLLGGAVTVFNTLLATADKELAEAGLPAPGLTIENYSSVLDGVIASLDENAVYQKALGTVQAKVEENRPLIEAAVKDAVTGQVKTQVTEAVGHEVRVQVEAAVKEQVTSQVISQITGQAGTPMTKEEYDAAMAGGMISAEVASMVENTISTQMQTEEVQAMIGAETDKKLAGSEIAALIQSKTEEQLSTEAIKNTISENIEIQVQQKISEAMASDEVQGQLRAASEGAQSLITLKAALDGYNSFYLGLVTYVNGVSTAAEGAGNLSSAVNSLKDGTSTLAAGTSKLKNGVSQLSGAAPALTDGVKQLKDGSFKLSDGLEEFNEKAIMKIVDAVDGDLTELSENLKAMVNVSRNTDRPVKIIYRTDKIGDDK